MALVAPGVIRFTLNGTVEGTHTWANIWDVRALGSTEQDRADLALRYAGHLLDAWNETIATLLHNTVVLDNVSWVDLDSEEGSTGETSVGFETTGPYAGDRTGFVAPVNTAILATKNVTSARGRRRGRMYIPGMPEAEISAGTLNNNYVTDANTQLANFLEEVTDPDELSTWGSFLPVVVHTENIGTPENPNIVYLDDSVITSLRAQSLAATQRRRLRR